jgi:hypothetical protein
MNFPVVDKTYKGGVYEALPHYDENFFTNKNRIDRDLNEVSKNFAEEYEGCCIIPARNKIVVEMYNPRNDRLFMTRERNNEHVWAIGKILLLGSDCFNSIHFPTGAPATFYDWVVFQSATAKCIKFPKTGKVLGIIEDRDILMPIESPKVYINL